MPIYKIQKVMDKDDFLKLFTKKMTAGLSPAEQCDYDLYIQQHKNYKEVPALLESYWHRSSFYQEGSSEHLDTLWKRIAGEEPLDKPTKRPFKRVLKWVSGMAAVFLLVWGMGYFINGQMQQAKDLTFETRNTVGEKLLMALKDGTQITMDRFSRIQYNTSFGDVYRQVSLQGAAYFKVAENKDIPMDIQVDKWIVQVKGTSFSIRPTNDKGAYELILFDGAVDLYPLNHPNKRIHIVPHQKVRWKSSDPTAHAFEIVNLNEDLLQREKLWTQDSIEFKKQRFKDLQLKLEEKYKVQFIYQNEQIKEKRFSGMIKDMTLREVLNVLRTSYPFEFEIKDTVVVIR